MGGSERAGGARVTLSIYSGQPNPEFVLTESEAAKIRALTDSLPPSATPRPQPSGLGYSGFQLRLSDSTEMVIYRDLVETRLGTDVRLLYDEDCALESELVLECRRHLGDDLPYDWIMRGR